MSVLSPRAPLPVLILDDDTETLTALSTEMQRWCTVEAYTDPQLALAAFRERDFSAVVSDLSMPTMNGLDFLGRCADIKNLVPRLLLTGHADLADLFESINRAKLNALLTKPWQPAELRDAVESAIRSGEIQRENEELRRIALTDALTGISNHRYFWERLESEFSRAQRYGRFLSLVMCDIDNFKQYNDQHGHPKGDAVLREVAQCLERNRRSMDSVARYGGEEFAIVLPEVSHQQALDIAKRHLSGTLKSTGISLSFGVATFPQDAPSTTELVHRADQALLRAKALGKAQVVSAAGLGKLPI